MYSGMRYLQEAFARAKSKIPPRRRGVGISAAAGLKIRGTGITLYKRSIRLAADRGSVR